MIAANKGVDEKTAELADKPADLAPWFLVPGTEPGATEAGESDEEERGA